MTADVDGTTQPMALHVDRLAGGRYELGELLGAGGMGLVRRARDRVLHRDVAVKLLADNLAADEVARERFLREARAAARIDDPNVVPVFDVGDEAGRPYLVMRLIDGPSLATVRDDGGLPPEELTAVASDALLGLAAAHRAGVLHRDVKPGNLLRGPDGRVLLTDLGVAEAAEAPGLTNTGTVMGTRAYLAPERLRGEPASVATDLYALGVTLRELRAPGRPPAPVDDLIRSLLSADPGGRPPDADTARRLLHDASTAETTIEATTRPLPVEEDPAAADATDAPTTSLPRAKLAPATARWTMLAGAAAAAGLVAVLTLTGEPAPPPTVEEPSIVEVADEQGEPPDTSPSEQARALAERLRERAGR